MKTTNTDVDRSLAGGCCSGPSGAVGRVQPAIGSEASEVEIRIKGRPVRVPCAHIDGLTVVATGRWFKMAVLQDEELLEGETVSDPASFVKKLKGSGLRCDIFTFAENVLDVSPRHGHHLEWDNWAVIPITTYSAWFENRVDAGARRAVRKAAKAGVEVRVAELDDEFVKGIVNINNETPIRQGRSFWHFQKSFDAVKAENSTYAERNVFLGAYYQGELIGFLRMTDAGTAAHILQVLTMVKH